MKKYICVWMAVLGLLISPAAHAQFTGVQDYISGPGCPTNGGDDITQCAAYQMRADLNNHLSGVVPISPSIVKLPFASLPAEKDGALYYCTDCVQTNPCASGGSGAWALGTRGAWACTSAGAGGSSYAATHSLTVSPACSASSGTNPSNDWFTGTLTANTTFALPSSGCIANDVISIQPTQASTPYTVAFTGSIQILAPGGACYSMPTGSGDNGLWQFVKNGISGNWSEFCPGTNPAQAAAMVNPMTTAGDMIVGSSSGTPARLAAGAVDTFLQGQGSGVAPAYSAALSSCSGSTNALTYNTGTHQFGCNTISGGGSPGGSSGQLQYNNSGAFGGVPAINGDGTLNTTTGALAVTKTAGTPFAASATTDATNASNISSGTLSVNRFNGGSGASSSTFLRGDGTWTAPSGSGAVNSGTSGDLAYYATTGTAVSGATVGDGLTLSGGNISVDNPVYAPSSQNFAVGSELLNASVSNDNSSFGFEALNGITNADDNSAFGYEAEKAGTLIADDVAVGFDALTANTTGKNNTAIGFDALDTFNDTGGSADNNTAIGSSAGASLSTGTGNIFLGIGGNITSGSSNILIGNSLAQTTATSSNQLDIGDFLYGPDSAGGTLTLNGTLKAIDGFELQGSSTGYTSLATANASATNYTATFPSASGTVALIGAALQGAMLTSNMSVTSSTTLAAVTPLSGTVTLQSGHTYYVAARFYSTNGGTGYDKIDFGGGTATASSVVGSAAFSATSGSNPWMTGLTSLTTAITTGSVGDNVNETADFFIVCNGSGTLVPRYAQDVSNATASVLQAGSGFTVEQIN